MIFQRICTALVFFVLTVSCTSALKLRQDIQELNTRIDIIHPRAKKCAPMLLASAEAETAVAQHHTSRGHGMIAANHIASANLLLDEATARANNSACTSKMVKPEVVGTGPAFPTASPPIPLPIVAIPPNDQDGDGVPDDKDLCPRIAGDALAKGCVLDADSDGIPDHKDACPKDPGSPEMRGCPYRYITVSQTRIKLREEIHFKNRDRKIAPDSIVMLDEITLVLMNDPGVRLRVEGHTDSKGSAQANQALSAKRAETVRQYLIGKGISDGRVISIGYGEAQPIGDNSTEAGRASNRRIEFHLLPGDSP